MISKRTISFAGLWLLGSVGIMLEHPETDCSMLLSCTEGKGFLLCKEQDLLMGLSKIKERKFQLKRLQISRYENQLKVEMACKITHFNYVLYRGKA